MQNEKSQVILELAGSNAVHGIGLAPLEAFLRALKNALRDFDRSQRRERTKRGGHPSVREQLVTAFALVELTPGSAVLTLEPVTPPADAAEDQQSLDDAESLAVQNFRLLVSAIESAEPLDAAVTESLSAARRALGNDGRIGIVLAGYPRRKKRRSLLLDERRVAQLEERSLFSQTRLGRVVGRLHMIDIDPPYRVGIKSPSGIDWFCEYSPELEERVRSLLGSRVVAEGRGELRTPDRGVMAIERIEAVREPEQSALFSLEAVPIARRVSEQRAQPQGWDAFADPEWTDDEEGKRYLETILGSEREH